jgi:hypothetical protein
LTTGAAAEGLPERAVPPRRKRAAAQREAAERQRAGANADAAFWGGRCPIALFLSAWWVPVTGDEAPSYWGESPRLASTTIRRWSAGRAAAEAGHSPVVVAAFLAPV